jgi:hypothetical protein
VTALCRSYASHAEALPAVDAVLEAGIPGEGVRVLTGEATRDARAGTVGEFAGRLEPGAPVGSFAGSHADGAATGAFAGGEQRGGSFADADRDIVTDYPHGVQRMRVAGHRKLERLLTDAGLDEPAAARDVKALHAGRILVLVDVPEADVDRVQALLDR